MKPRIVVCPAKNLEQAKEAERCVVDHGWHSLGIREGTPAEQRHGWPYVVQYIRR